MLLTTEQIIAKVREIAANEPDHVYKRLEGRALCMNVHEDYEGNLTPGCIMGKAFFELGVPLTKLYQDNAAGVGQLTSTYTAGAWSSDNVRWLGWVQQRQDEGYTWAEAVRKADESVQLS